MKTHILSLALVNLFAGVISAEVVIPGVTAPRVIVVGGSTPVVSPKPPQLAPVVEDVPLFNPAITPDALQPTTERVLVVYTMPNCSACVALKSRLMAAGTEFMEDKSMPGFRAYPVSRYENRTVRGSLTVATAKPATAICKCQGSNRGVCFCLQNNIPCKCHATKGSEWNLDSSGRAVSKTGSYANPMDSKLRSVRVTQTVATQAYETRRYYSVPEVQASERPRRKPGLIGAVVGGVFRTIFGGRR
jgi:hypothetical protein